MAALSRPTGTGLSKEMTSEWAWPEYYQAFPEFSENTVREGCQPRKMVHSTAPGKAIILVHGLSDSPFYLTAIGEFFYTFLGYDVYLPLLQGHGLRRPKKQRVAHAKWQENVRFAIRSASQRACRMSIGGLSMGGALSFHLACTDPAINGELYLFSAALGLASGPFFVPGWLKEYLLLLPGVQVLDPVREVVGNNPYRYQWISLQSAAQLVQLMRENQEFLNQAKTTGRPALRVFSAWTEADQVVSPAKIGKLRDLLADSQVVPFVFEKDAGVDHASLVLPESIYGVGAPLGSPPLEKANPHFAELLAAIGRFEAGE